MMRRVPYSSFLVWLTVFLSLSSRAAAEADQAKQRNAEDLQRTLKEAEAQGKAQGAINRVRGELTAIQNELTLYRSLYNKNPYSIQDISEDEQIKRDKIYYEDPWGSPYEYLIRADIRGKVIGYDIVSLGPDKQFGTPDDIYAEHAEATRGEAEGQRPITLETTNLTANDIKQMIDSRRVKGVEILSTSTAPDRIELIFQASSNEIMFEFLDKLKEVPMIERVTPKSTQKITEGVKATVTCLLKRGFEIR